MEEEKGESRLKEWIWRGPGWVLENIGVSGARISLVVW